MHRAAGPIRLPGADVAGGGELCLRKQLRIASAPCRVEERSIRLLRRMGEATGEGVNEHRCAALDDRKRFAP